MPRSHEEHESIIKIIDDHENRIRSLELNEARINEKLECLIEKIDSLMTWIKALVMMGLTSLVGFLFWYLKTFINK
ncbi:MAG: hypothetical protein N4A68_14200 [Maledivibacter sp.]|nr:hypothetical protein [Maledivibacter sp.]